MDECRVLVIYSGGTIGMLESPEGKKTYPGFLYDNLRCQARFNDPSGATIFSHSRDIESFREWRRTSSRESSRAPSPLPSSSTYHVPSTDVDATTLPVITPHGTVRLPSLKTPKSSGRSVRYVIYEYENLIDSSDIGFADWVKMASDIEANYKLYDAFIILHGTDSMSYSASALSFLLENLGKPVILTGAQIPLSEVRNDAVDNLLGALAIAGNFTIPEVSLFFHHTLYRGCRSTKSSSSDFEAFSSPNQAPLARVGINIDVDWQLVLRPTALKPFRVHKQLSSNVATLRLFPGITTSSVKAFLAAPLEGVVLSTYGAGNCPQRKDLLQAFRDATDRGLVIINVTQCQKGTVEGSLYENGRKLEATGVIGGADMTIECALAKLSYLLAKGLAPEQVRDLIAKPLRGDLTPPKPLISDLSASTDGRIQGLFARLLLVSSKQSGRQTTSALSQVAGEGFSENDLISVEGTLNPLLIASAAARPDKSLENLLTTLLSDQSTSTARQQGLSLLNTFSTLSPLHVACLHGHVRNVELLLSHGASVHLRDIQGHTALYYAATSKEASHQQKLQLVQTLKLAGAHLASAESEEQTMHSTAESAEIWEAAGKP